MERDPLRLAWTTAPALHGLAMLLLGVAGLLLLLEIDFIRIIVDGVSSAAATVPFLRVAIPVPSGLGLEPVVLFGGIPLEPQAFKTAAIASLALIPFVIALLLVLLDWIAVEVGAKVLKRVRTAVLDTVLKSPPSARDEASSATNLASEPLAREGDVLGFALLTSVRVGGMIGLALSYTFVADWYLGAALSVILIVAAILCGRRLTGRVDAAQARRVEGEKTGETLTDLLIRMPALRAHGTGPYERSRIRQDLIGAHSGVQRRERRFALV